MEENKLATPATNGKLPYEKAEMEVIEISTNMIFNSCVEDNSDYEGGGEEEQ